MKKDMKKKSDGCCEMCGHYVFLRQKAHIVSEGGNGKYNILMLCPTCHLMFDTSLKPKLLHALRKNGAKQLPSSWTKSIYKQAAEASKRKPRA